MPKEEVMEITAEMREKATLKFRALLKDRVVWTATESWSCIAGSKLSEMRQIIEAARKMGVTEANPGSLTEKEGAEAKERLETFRRLEMDEEAFDLILEVLRKVGVEEEHLRDIKLPEK